MIKLKKILEMSGVKGMKWGHQKKNLNLPGVRGKYEQSFDREGGFFDSSIGTESDTWVYEPEGDEEYEITSGEVLNTRWNKLRDKEKVWHLTNYAADIEPDLIVDPVEREYYTKEKDKALSMAKDINWRMNYKKYQPLTGYRENAWESYNPNQKGQLNEVGVAPQHKKFIKNIYKAEENMHKHIMLYKNFLNSKGLKKEANEIGSKYVGIVGKFTHWMKITWTKMVRKMI